MGTQVRTTRTVTGVGSVLLLAVAGCGSAGGTASAGATATTSPAQATSSPGAGSPTSGTPTGSSSGSSSAPSSSTPGSSSGSGTSAGAWLAYHRSGGFAGVDDSITVSADGTVVVATRTASAHRFRLPQAELARMRRLADRVDVPAHPAPSLPARGTADAFTIVLTIDGKRVAVPDGRVPGDLAPLVTRMSALMTRA